MVVGFSPQLEPEIYYTRICCDVLMTFAYFLMLQTMDFNQYIIMPGSRVTGMNALRVTP